MTETEIEAAANQTLEDHDLTSTLPIDPFFIAREEQIILLPGDYDNCFDARIEYRRKGGVGRFYLFYTREDEPFRPPGRVRFSIAHELGHFYLPEHREYLLSGRWHNSHSDFVSSTPREREADRYAACLLMPEEPFVDHVRVRSGFLTLKDLQGLATQVFNTSLTSTTLRYVDLDFEPCCVVMAERGIVKWSRASEDMRRQVLGWIERGIKVPTGSITAKAVIAQLSGAPAITDGPVDSSVWFSRRNSCRMWEEVLVLTNWGRTLTFLTLQDQPDDYD